MTKAVPKRTTPGVVVFLGAGFSHVSGVPLAAELFDREPLVDRITRKHLVDRVQRRWRQWHESSGGSAEEYLAALEGGPEWKDAVWYVGLVVALQMGKVERVGFQPQLEITRHNIDRTTSNVIHEEFWTTIFRRTSSVTVVTTNYDVLPERGLRIAPRPRVPRPGFHYGFGDEYLAGGGYPPFERTVARGRVPLLKLHGSISWSIHRDEIVRYHDCRPAIRGDPLLVAPVAGKRPPECLQPTWDLARTALQTASLVIGVGYSLPEYDELVRDLLASTRGDADFHIFDPDPRAGPWYEHQLHRKVVQHRGLPEAFPDLAALCAALAERDVTG